ncbi:MULTISPECIES: diaminobutyrate--2-oxoglutarate transaminase [unclassified Bradyrhizobium]|uniref:diaminobutyrate--2-oxoglutarate transaminase n=1 Tax=unclassified Bradyrhizobium TaxID=2631580 RepID=UPI0028EE4242|nr:MULTISPECIES: diaminobutyrate--2-oxoglutarate transaminase [unclassified Bradyrhizobium]
MYTTIFDCAESNVRSYCRHFPVTFSSASGAWMVDTDGRKYLDLLAGAGSLNYGHNNPLIVAPVIEYLNGSGIVQSLDLHTVAKAEFLQAFSDRILAPRGLTYKIQFTGPTGTNAVEAALKLARKITGRTNVVAFTNGYHGMSLGALALTSNPVKRAGAGVALTNVTFLPYDGYFGPSVDVCDYIEAMLTSPGSGIDRPAAVIVELVQGEGGLAAARMSWIERIAGLCREIGALLIVDDIQAGCGRTGSFFSFEGSAVQPDMVVLSKSLSGLGAPLSVVLIRPDLDIWSPGEHNGTFRGNNLAFVGATAAIRCYWTNGDFARSVQEHANVLTRELTAIADSTDGEASVVGRGLITGLSFRSVALADQISKRLFENGVIAETCGVHDHVVKLLPPLTISSTDLSFAIDTLREVVASTLGRPAQVDAA